MIAVEARHARFGQSAAWRNVAFNSVAVLFAPLNVERAQLWVELHVSIRQMVMGPPRQGAPIGAFGITISEPGHNYARCRSLSTFSVRQVPDMVSGIPFYACSVTAIVAICRDLGRAIAGPDGDASEGCPKRFQQQSAELLPDMDRNTGIAWDVWNPVEIGNLRVQEIWTWVFEVCEVSSVSFRCRAEGQEH